MGQILARRLLEPDFGNLGLASWLLKFASGNLGNGPFSAKSRSGIVKPDLGNLEPWESFEI